VVLKQLLSLVLAAGHLQGVDELSLRLLRLNRHGALVLLGPRRLIPVSDHVVERDAQVGQLVVPAGCQHGCRPAGGDVGGELGVRADARHHIAD